MADQKLLNTMGPRWLWILAVAWLLLGFPQETRASWLIYHKPAFEGQILDQETKQPIEGAVVVALYHKWTLGLGAGSTKPLIHVKETLTDKDGKFHIPLYTTLIQPFSGSDDVGFIIYKPGYVGVDRNNTFYYEGLFSGKFTIGTDKMVSCFGSRTAKIGIMSPNIVELPFVKTREEKLEAWRSASVGLTYEIKKMPILIDLLKKEEQNIY